MSYKEKNEGMHEVVLGLGPRLRLHVSFETSAFPRTIFGAGFLTD